MNDNEIIKKYRERIKKQNERIKQDYDRINAILPKGTKERIQAQGQTINSFINYAVLAELDRLENIKQVTPPMEQAQPTDTPQDIENFNNWLRKIQEENEQKHLAEATERQIKAELDNN